MQSLIVSWDAFSEGHTLHTPSYVIQITFLDLHHPFTIQFGHWAARLCQRRAGMLECFLLLRQSGGRWIPLFAVPGVLAGGVAAISLMLSGFKGIITDWYRPKRRAGRAPVVPI
jgi:hypothetical protein